VLGHRAAVLRGLRFIWEKFNFLLFVPVTRLTRWLGLRRNSLLLCLFEQGKNTVLTLVSVRRLRRFQTDLDF